MTTMHPHWQATEDDGSVVVPVDSMSAAPVREAVIEPRVTVRTASRKPAAVLGILLVLGIGYVAMGGEFSLPGQVASNAASIVLTKDGPNPESLNVTPGMTVEWKNEDTIPHVLSFDGLSSGGKPLETSPIFPGSTSKMLIPATAKAGTYGYISKTSDISGEIVIATASKSSSSAPKQAAVSAELPSSASSAMEFPPSSSAPALPASALVPVNMHTVGNPNQKPVEPMHAGAPLVPVTQHKPLTNTASGPANWVLIGLTTLVVLVATRRAFR